MANLFQSIIDETLESQFTEEDVTTFLATRVSMENQVGERMRSNMGILNGQITINGRSTLPPQNYHIVSSHEAWNSRYSQIYNINNNQSQVVVPNGYGELVAGSVQRSRPEQFRGIQTHPVAPANANRATTQLEKTMDVGYWTGVVNQNATPMASSIGPTNAIFPQQNQRQNLPSGRELWREEPNEAARNFSVREGRLELQWENRQINVGEGSSSKRQKTGSVPKEGANTSLVPRQANNNAVENSRLQNANNDPGNLIGYRNSLYDPVFVSLGLAIDPHIRFFDAQNSRTEKDHHVQLNSALDSHANSL